SMLSFLSPLRPPPISTLFPYTTLFRSGQSAGLAGNSETSRQPVIQAQPAPCPAEEQRHQHHQVGGGELDAIVQHHELAATGQPRSEEHTSELQSRENLVCRLLLEKKKQ